MKNSTLNNAVHWAAMLLLTLTLLKTEAADYIDNTTAPNSELVPLVHPLLKAINSGDRSKIEQFAKLNFSTSFMPTEYQEEVVNYLLSLSFGYGELKFHSFRHYQPSYPDELLIVLYSPLTESWKMLSLMNDEMKPNKIGNLNLSPALWPSDIEKPKDISEHNAVNELNKFIHRMAEHKIFSGTVLLARGKEILLQAAVGESNKSFNIKNNLNTRFDLASMSKMFTAVAINQLFQSGQLHPTDTLDKYLDTSWLPKKISKDIQIQHLLTHTSGLGNYAVHMGNISKNKLIHLNDYKGFLNKESLAFLPETNQMYSNSGMFLLGVVIEKLSNQSYFDYIQSHVFSPANMKDSAFLERNQPHKNVAVGYEHSANNETGWFDNSGIFGNKGTPDGGSFSTIFDMHNFALALSQNKLLSKEVRNQMLTSKPELNSPLYGFGFNISGQEDAFRVGHEGGHYGISTSFNWYPNTGYTIIVLSNITEGAISIDNKARELIERIK